MGNRLYDSNLMSKYSIVSIYSKASRLKLTTKGRHPLQKPGLDKKLKCSEAAYLAGIIDGEGWITIERGLYYMIGVGNTSLELLEWIQNVVGAGTIRKNKIYGNQKQAWTYKLSGALPVHDLLKQIRKYMIIKQEKADNAISFIKKLM